MTKRKKTDDGSDQKGSNVPRNPDTKPTKPPHMPWDKKPVKNPDDGSSKQGSNVPRRDDTRPTDKGAGTPR